MEYLVMHLLWWIIWMILLFWIFATPYNIPGRRSSNLPFEILRRRFAAGEITKEEYEQRKRFLESETQTKLN
jgi:putative membrane protein